MTKEGIRKNVIDCPLCGKKRSFLIIIETFRCTYVI